MRGHDQHRVGAHRKYLAVDLELLERFPNRCSRFVRVVRRFSVAFVAAKRPLKPLRSSTSAALAIFFLPLLRGPEGPHYPNGRIHQLWNRTGVPTHVLDKTALAFCASLYRESLGLMSGPLSRTQNDCSRHNQIVQDE